MMPAIKYKNAEGKPLRGVTTVLNILAKPALIGWAYKQGIAGVPLYESRDKAADAGTLAHQYVENHLKGLPDPTKDGLQQDVIEKAESCYLAFLEWEKAHSFKMVESELSLISEQYKFGGTIDIGAVVNDLGIVDIKTSGGVYFSMKVQVSAYGMLWNENFPDRPIKAYHILRIGEMGDFSHHYWPNLNEEWEVFKACLKIQEVLDKTKQKL
jgi:hypothetical protein